MGYDWTGTLANALGLDPGASGRGAQLASVGAGMQAAIERATGRTMTPVTRTEAYDGSGRDILFLRWDPIRSVSSLSMSGSTVTVGDPAAPAYPPAQCVIAPSRGYLQLTGTPLIAAVPVFPRGVANIIITYVSGFDLDDDGLALKQAVVEWAKLIYKNADRVGIKSVSAGGQTISYDTDQPAFVKAAIAAHRRLVKSC